MTERKFVRVVPKESFPVAKPAVLPAIDAPELPGIKGRVPFRVAQAIKPTVLGDHERAVLQKLGWKEGDPIPADLAQRINPEMVQEILKSVARESLKPPVPEDTPPMVVPPEQTLASLDPQHRAEIEDLLAQAKTVYEQQQDDALPSQQQLEVGQDLVLEDDTKNTKPAAPAEAAPQNQTGVTQLAAPGRCVHCGWDQSVSDIEVTKTDRDWFLQAILGQIQFEKVYELLGGHLLVAFRELTTKDLQQIYEHVRQELAGKMDKIDLNSFYDAVEHYRVAVQTSRVAIGEAAYEFPPLSEVTLTQLAELVDEKLRYGTIYRIVRLKLAEFNRLVAKLEAMSDDENFWKAA